MYIFIYLSLIWKNIVKYVQFVKGIYKKFNTNADIRYMMTEYNICKYFD